MFVKSIWPSPSKHLLFTMHELAYHLDGYVMSIVTYSDLVVIIGDEGQMKEFDRLLSTKVCGDHLQFSYDTTFQLGDVYLSTLVYKHVLFKEEPVIPLAFVIHERKFQKVHEDFLFQISKSIPKLKTVSLPMIVDSEIAITKTIQNTLPNLTPLHCWNHLKRDVRFQLGQLGASADEKQFYISEISDLLK